MSPIADNTVQSGADTIATDDVTTLNGAGSTGVKVQRVKVAYGDDGSARDASVAFPLPVDNYDTTATGNLTAVGSVTVSTANGGGVVGVQITGTWVATVVFEGSTDGTNFFAVNAVASVTGTQIGTTAANGQWRINSGGYASVRARVSAFTSGTVAVTLVSSGASTLTTLAEPLPAGTNTIGAITGTGSAGIPAAGVLTVQGNASGVALPVSLATNTPTIAAGANQIGTIGEMRASPLAVTVAGAAATATTLTLPAAAAGLFHYITSLTIDLYSTAARTGVATPIVVTSTNLPGSLAWTFSTAGALGAIDRYIVTLTTPLKSSAAATATTVVGPAVTGGLWRINATYFTAV